MTRFARPWWQPYLDMVIVLGAAAFIAWIFVGAAGWL